MRDWLLQKMDAMGGRWGVSWWLCFGEDHPNLLFPFLPVSAKFPNLNARTTQDPGNADPVTSTLIQMIGDNTSTHAGSLFLGLFTNGLMATALAMAGMTWLAVAHAAPDAAALALHTEGAQLKDAAGKAIVLRGVNHHGFLDVPDGAWDPPGKPLYSGMGHWDPAVVRGTLGEYRKLGFNVVRFHTVVEWWKSNPRTYQDPWRTVTYPEPYRQMMKDVVGWAGERGLYVIFDFFAMKNVNGKQSGQEKLPWPPYNRHPDVVSSRAEFLDIWNSVARELASFPNVLFELYNEPNGDEKAEADWFTFCQEAITAIRLRTSNPVIVQWDYQCWVNLDYPPPHYRASTLTWIARHPLKGDNIVYGTHLYRNSGGGGPGMAHRSQNGQVNLWETADIRKALELARFPSVAGVLPKPLLVTEFGAYVKSQGTELDHELLWFKNTLDILNSWSVGYVGWSWGADEQLDHGMLHQGAPNKAGRIFVEAIKIAP
jgi:aryl-phospho-beta-D-glucosidase BglC (GH1 family)